MDRAWITIVVGIGSFLVSIQSIYLGYLLFLAGATGAFKFNAQIGTGSVGLESIAPGSLLFLFGAVLAAYTVQRLVGRS